MLKTRIRLAVAGVAVTTLAGGSVFALNAAHASDGADWEPTISQPGADLDSDLTRDAVELTQDADGNVSVSAPDQGLAGDGWESTVESGDALAVALTMEKDGPAISVVDDEDLTGDGWESTTP